MSLRVIGVLIRKADCCFQFLEDKLILQKRFLIINFMAMQLKTKSLKKITRLSLRERVVYGSHRYIL